MADAYDIHKSNRECCVTGKVLAEGEEYYSVLVEADGQLVRKDYSTDAWTEEPEGTIGVWKTKVPPKDPPKKLVINVDVMLDFFNRLDGDESDASKVNMRYLLALLLMRKRVLKFDDVQREGVRSYMILRRPRDDTSYRVLDPNLSEQELEELQSQMETVIGARM